MINEPHPRAALLVMGKTPAGYSSGERLPKSGEGACRRRIVIRPALRPAVGRY